MTLKINGHFNLLFAGEVGKLFLKLLADFARGLFFLLGLHGKHFTICEAGNNVFLKQELELVLPFNGKAQLCTQKVSQGKY